MTAKHMLDYVAKFTDGFGGRRRKVYDRLVAGLASGNVSLDEMKQLEELYWSMPAEVSL